MTITIVVGNKKGGVGKSTTVINLAYIFTQVFKKTVLLIDADPQSNATSLFSKVNARAHTIKDIVLNKRGVLSCICKTKYKGLDIIKGNPELKESDVVNEDWLTYIKDVVGGVYDIILVDTRPTFERLTESAIAATDIFLTPIALDKFCKDNLAQVEDFIEEYINQGLIWKVFANRCKFRQKGQKAIFEDLLEKHTYPFMESCVSESGAIANALAFNKPVQKHRSRSTGALDYVELAEELLEVIESEV